MGLKNTIDADIKTAMLAKDKDGLRALRGIKQQILLEETKEGANEGGLTAEQEIKLLSKAVKQRRESAEIFTAQNRPDLAEPELVEVAIIERYLPKQLTEQEIELAVKHVIEQEGATTLKDMGRVIAAANKSLAGQAEGKAIADAVKRLLA
jgi:uncharacterized protein YqeY